MSLASLSTEYRVPSAEYRVEEWRMTQHSVLGTLPGWVFTELAVVGRDLAPDALYDIARQINAAASAFQHLGDREDTARYSFQPAACDLRERQLVGGLVLRLIVVIGEESPSRFLRVGLVVPTGPAENALPGFVAVPLPVAVGQSKIGIAACFPTHNVLLHRDDQHKECQKRLKVLAPGATSEPGAAYSPGRSGTSRVPCVLPLQVCQAPQRGGWLLARWPAPSE